MNLDALKKLEKIEFKQGNAEAKVREAFVMPIIEFLGYKDEHRDIIRENEFKIKMPFFKLGTKKISLTKLQADFILGISGTKDIVIDAKSPSFDVEEPEFLMQAYSYASHIEVNARYFIITNGLTTNVYYTHDNRIKPILSVKQKDIARKALILYDLLCRKNIRKKNNRINYDHEVEREKINFLNLFIEESKNGKYPLSPKLYFEIINMNPKLSYKLYSYLTEYESKFKDHFSLNKKQQKNFQIYFDLTVSKLLRNFLKHERIGIVVMAFISEKMRKKYLNTLKETIKSDRFLVVEAQWIFNQVAMPYLLVIICDGWQFDEDEKSYDLPALKKFFNSLRTEGLSVGYDFDVEFYNPERAEIFITNKEYMKFLDPRIVYDTGDTSYIFDIMRMMSIEHSPEKDDSFVSVSISGERIDVYRSYDPEEYSFWLLVKKIRNNIELDDLEKWWLEYFCEIDDYKFDKFISQVKSAKKLTDIPFQNKSRIDNIRKYKSRF